MTPKPGDSSSEAIADETNALGTGVDPSREMRRIAASDDVPHVIFAEGTAEDPSLADEQFDLAFSVDVIHHVQRHDMAAREMYRVLKPVATAAIVIENEADIRNRTPQVTYFPETIAVELERYPAIDVIRAELRDAGFDAGETIPVSMPHEVSNVQACRDKAFSSLHLISSDTFATGLRRMEAELKRRPDSNVHHYTIVTGRRPQ